MLNKIKNCAFQYATAPRWGDVKVFEDTGLITLDEAKEFWEKYKPSFIEQLEKENNPEMVIWINMKTPTDYRQTLAHATRSTETDGKEIFITLRKYFDL